MVRPEQHENEEGKGTIEYCQSFCATLGGSLLISGIIILSVGYYELSLLSPRLYFAHKCIEAGYALAGTAGVLMVVCCGCSYVMKMEVGAPSDVASSPLSDVVVAMPLMPPPPVNSSSPARVEVPTFLPSAPEAPPMEDNRRIQEDDLPPAYSEVCPEGDQLPRNSPPLYNRSESLPSYSFVCKEGRNPSTSDPS